MKAGGAKPGEVLITRDFDASREMVFDAWTDPKQLMRWYSPRRCTLSFEHIDVRTGGSFLSCISDKEFGDCKVKGTYVEVTRPERLVQTMIIVDKKYQHPEWPIETRLTVTFEALGPDRTRMVLHQAVSEELAKRTGAYPSWLEMLDRLAETLAK